MSDKPLPFVVNDRRKFTSEGEPRPDAEIAPSEPKPVPVHSPEPVQPAVPNAVTPFPASHEPTGGAIYDTPQAASYEAFGESDEQPQELGAEDPNLPPAPTAEQQEQARIAFTATADRIETAIRATNPGMDHPPAMSFETVVQSVYMQAILQLGGGAQEGQQPQVDLLGARQSIDMLGVLADKTIGNRSGSESRLIESALFELRLAFLEITQALARSAQQRAGGAPPAPGVAPVGGPRIVR